MFVMLPVPLQYSVNKRQKVSDTILNLTATSTSFTTQQTSINILIGTEKPNNNNITTTTTATTNNTNFILTVGTATSIKDQPSTLNSFQQFYIEENTTKNYSDKKIFTSNNNIINSQNQSETAVLFNKNQINKFGVNYLSNNTNKNDIDCIKGNHYTTLNFNNNVSIKALTTTIKNIVKNKLGPIVIKKSHQYFNRFTVGSINKKFRNYKITKKNDARKVIKRELLKKSNINFDFKTNGLNFTKIIKSFEINKINKTYNNKNSGYNKNNNQNSNSYNNNYNNKNNCTTNNTIINSFNKINNNDSKKYKYNKDINKNFENKIHYLNDFNNKILLNDINRKYSKDILSFSQIKSIAQNNENNIININIKKINNINKKSIHTATKITNNNNCTSIIKRKTNRFSQISYYLPSNNIFSNCNNIYLRRRDKSNQIVIPAKLNNSSEQTSEFEQTPVAIIFNYPSTIPSEFEIKFKKRVNSMNHMTQKGFQNDTPDIKAMRYYRLWIYTCNAALLLGVIIFCGTAGKVLMAEYKRLLINDLNLGQPSFIYAYLALLMQSGFLQLIGCLGALRLSEKLLNTYLLLLLLLLIGDVMLGLFWMFKFDKIMETFEPILRNRLSTDYGSSNEFTYLWNRLQIDGKCCGILGVQDFPNKSSILSSCCDSGLNSTEHISVSRKLLASALVFRSDELSAQQKQNVSNNNNVDSAWSHILLGTKMPGINGSDPEETTTTTENGNFFKSSNSHTENIKNNTVCKDYLKHGCKDFLAEWLRNTADILFVIGYCVITFLKLSFLGILRYEIREMIQKIRLLQNENAAALAEQELNQNQLTQVTSASINGGLHTITESKIGNHEREKERSRISFAEGERESLLVKEVTPLNYLRKKHLYGCSDFGDTSGTLDSNKSLCMGENSALGHSFECNESNYNIGDTLDSFNNSCSGGARNSTTLTGANCTAGSRENANIAAAKSLNSNSYELNEFDTKTPKYRKIENDK